MCTDDRSPSHLAIGLLLSALLCAFVPLVAQESPATGLPVEIAALHASTMSRLSATTRSWIAEQGRKISQQNSNATALRTASLDAVGTRFTGATPADLVALAQLVLAEAFRAASDDQRATLERVRRQRELAGEIRAYATVLREEIARNESKKPTDVCDSEVCTRLARGLNTLMSEMRDAGIATITMSPSIATVGDMQLVRDQLYAVSQRLETDDQNANASGDQREHLREAIRDYRAKVSAMKGTY